MFHTRRFRAHFEHCLLPAGLLFLYHPRPMLCPAIVRQMLALVVAASAEEIVVVVVALVGVMVVAMGVPPSLTVVVAVSRAVVTIVVIISIVSREADFLVGKAIVTIAAKLAPNIVVVAHSV